MKKKAKLVEFLLKTRVVVNDSDSEEQIVNRCYDKIRQKIDNEELNENVWDIKDDLDCPLGTFESDLPQVEKVILSTHEYKYIVVGKGFPTQVISFNDYSDWDSIIGYNNEAVLDCQIDYDEEYMFQTVDYKYLDGGKITTGRNYESVPVVVHKKGISDAWFEETIKVV